MITILIIAHKIFPMVHSQSVTSSTEHIPCDINMNYDKRGGVQTNFGCSLDFGFHSAQFQLYSIQVLQVGIIGKLIGLSYTTQHLKLMRQIILV